MAATLSEPVLTLLHFNDVYELLPAKAEPVGGVSRFATVVKRLRARAASSAPAPAPLLLFSGDAISPSLLSTVMRGRHMVDALNAVGVDAACVGNHDVDFGVPTFEALCGIGSDGRGSSDGGSGGGSGSGASGGGNGGGGAASDSGGDAAAAAAAPKTFFAFP